MAGKVADIGLVNSATIGACFGVSERRVQQLAAAGIIDCIKKGKLNRYDLVETVHKYVEYLCEDQPSDEATGFAERKLKAEAEYRETKTAQEKLKLMELEGTMHRSDDVKAATEQLVYTVRSMLVALPGRLAVDVADVGSAAEASDIIRREVNAVMDELTNYRYDPEVYAQMVRERQGWREVDIEDEGGDD